MRNYGKFVKPSSRIWTIPTKSGLLCRRQSKFHYWASPLFIFLFIFLVQSGNFISLAADEIKEPTGIVINEILPSPEGPDNKEEWIEIFNQNDFEVDLSLWKIADTVGKTTTYTFPKGTKILPKGFLLLDRPKTKITLNNSDGLKLIQPDGKIIDLVVYESAFKGQSYNRIGSKWFWSQTLTPTGINIISAPISKARDVESSKEKKITPEKSATPSVRPAALGLAAVGEIRDSLKFFPFLIALGIAIFSGAIILIMKRKLSA